jgi:FkbM family methyltransferase
LSLLSTLSFIWSHPLNKPARMAAIGRFVRWQLLSRVAPGLTALPFAGGTSLFARRGMTGATGNFYSGLHEYRDMAFVLHALRAGNLFVDVGANVGSYTVLASGVVGARTIAVEPIPATFKSLELNVVLNGLTDLVELQCLGLSDQKGVLRFTESLDTVNHVATENESVDSVEVRVATLDEVLQGRSPTVIKIDVEGHERAVLSGATKTLTDPALIAVVMETNASGARYGVSDDELIQTLVQFGFERFTYDPFARRLISAVQRDGNTLFVRDIDIVAKRVRESARYQLLNGEI